MDTRLYFFVPRAFQRQKRETGYEANVPRGDCGTRLYEKPQLKVVGAAYHTDNELLTLLAATGKGLQLYGLSSSVVLQLFQAEANKLEVGGIVPPGPASSTGGPFVCVPCFNHFEKLINARANLRQLESELRMKLKTAYTQNAGKWGGPCKL